MVTSWVLKTPWDEFPQFRKLPLPPSSRIYVKNDVFWGVAPCRSCLNRRFGGTYGLHLQGSEEPASLQPPVHAGSSLADFSTLKMEAKRSSETLVHTISTRRHIPKHGILHSHRHEDLKSYKDLRGLSIHWYAI
jgi:hypothetical protein